MSDSASEGPKSAENGRQSPFGVRVAATESPLVLSFPHSGLQWPANVPAPEVEDLSRFADHLVHRLAESLDITAVQAHFSRLLIDLNRAPDDIRKDLVPDHPAPSPRRLPGLPADETPPQAPAYGGMVGRGVVWAEGIPAGVLTYAGLRDRLSRFYEPYHRAIADLLAERRARFGAAVLLDVHSMPGESGGELVLGCLGGRTAHPALVRAGADALRAGGPELRVDIDRPYPGGALIARHGSPDANVHAIQLEISRDLYLMERGGQLRYMGDELDMPQGATWPRIAPDSPRARRFIAARDALHSLVRRLASG